MNNDLERIVYGHFWLIYLTSSLKRHLPVRAILLRDSKHTQISALVLSICCKLETNLPKVSLYQNDRLKCEYFAHFVTGFKHVVTAWTTEEPELDFWQRLKIYFLIPILRCAILRCAILRCAILRCAILRCAILRCAIPVVCLNYIVR